MGLDEKLLRRLNEPDDAKAASTRRRGTDAKWKLDPRDVPGTRFLFWILFLFHPATNFLWCYIYGFWVTPRTILLVVD